MEKPKLSEDEKTYLRAAAEGKVEDLRRFLDRGIPVDLLDTELFLLGLTWDTTALMYAAGKGRLEAVQFLVKAGANISAKSKAHKQDGGGESQALHFAIESGNPAVIEELLNGGADIDAQGNWGTTPLSIAAVNGNVEVVKLLLKRGAKANLKTKRKTDMPPLYAAVAGKEVPPPVKLDLVNILIQAGADVDAIGDASQTAINRLSSIRDLPDEIGVQLFQSLLKAGATVDHADKFGGTALQGALFGKSAEVVKVLVDAGADVNRVFATGTPLEIVEKKIQSLQKRSADPSLPERWREPTRAELSNAQKMLQVLTDRGAKRKSELGQ
jgi:ankyrin repeat protein